MNRVIFGLVFAAAAIVLAVFFFITTFDINSYRAHIESAASDAVGLDVRIKGKMGLSFFPFGVSAGDIHVSGRGGDVLVLEDLRLGAELMPLLNKRLKVTSCELVKPVVTIVKEADGKYNYEGPERRPAKGPPETAFNVKDFRLSGGALVYLDRKTGKKTEFRDISLDARDLSISGDILRDASFTGSLDCREVLQKDFRIEKLRASVRAVRGSYNFEPLALEALVFFDMKTGAKTELKEISLAISDLSLTGGPGEISKKLSFTGSLDCREVRKKDFRIDKLRSPVKAEKGVFYLTSVTMDIFGARGAGDATADTSKAGAVYKINMKVPGLDFEKLQESFSAKKVIGGKGDLQASLTIKVQESGKLLSGIDGTFYLRGDNLVMHTMDLDKVLSSFESSQEFNLVDLGAYFVAGPFSTFAVRGYRYGDLYSQTRGGPGGITQLISRWKIHGGVAEALDCALATKNNRVALKGRLDLVRERYDDVIVALLDAKGCAKIRQGISGPFDSPQIGSVSAVESLAGPISDLFRKAKRFLRGGRCEVFYSGGVKQPPE